MLAAAALVACGTGTPASRGASASRAALERYVARVEPIRLGVNRLLEGADPILRSLREHRIAAATAARRMGELERRFAEFTVGISAVQPQASALRQLQAEYAQTYVLEDAYLSALVSGLENGDLTDLPNTQAEQRAAIIRWRTGLTLLARQASATLPSDLQRAGRGEIAPSVTGAS